MTILRNLSRTQSCPTARGVRCFGSLSPKFVSCFSVLQSVICRSPPPPHGGCTTGVDRDRTGYGSFSLFLIFQSSLPGGGLGGSRFVSINRQEDGSAVCFRGPPDSAGPWHWCWRPGDACRLRLREVTWVKQHWFHVWLACKPEPKISIFWRIWESRTRLWIMHDLSKLCVTYLCLRVSAWHSTRSDNVGAQKCAPTKTCPKQCGCQLAGADPVSLHGNYLLWR